MALSPQMPSAQSDIQRARHFFARQGAQNPYDHSHAVYQKAVRFGIIDEGIIRDESKDMSLRMNHLLRRRLALIHVLDSSKVHGNSGALPRCFASDQLLEELDVFEKLTALERRGAPKSEFLALLNNGKRPLAPLIKIPDCSLTHDTEDALSGFIVNGTKSLVRQYPSQAEARLAMQLDLKAAEKIWAPFASFYGFQELSGDIFLQSYRVNHPEVYALVMANMSDPLNRDRIAHTQAIAKEVARVISRMLESYGFQAEVPVRKLKHFGKQMEKTYRFLSDDYAKLPRESRHGLSEFVTSHVASFDFDRFNDLVAARAIVSRFRGQGIDQLIKGCGQAVEAGVENNTFDISQMPQILDAIQVPALRLAVKVISDALTTLPLLYPAEFGEFSCQVEFKKKANGYHGFHFDTKALGENGFTLVPFEIQMRTTEWHYISERGGAAHYLYKGGDDNGPVDGELIETLGKGYHDLLYGSGSSSSSPPAIKG